MKRENSPLDLHENWSYNCSEFGEEKQQILAIDSYLNEPELLKQFAVRNARFSVADSYYPGIRMDAPQAYSIALVRNLGSFIERFFGLRIKDIKKVAAKYSIVTTQPDDLSLMQKIPHFDSPSRNSLAVIHYLCEDANAGTAMYRHKHTGFEYIDKRRYDEYMASVKAHFSNTLLHPKSYISESSDEYEQILAFEAKFNRLIMYRGSSLHSGIIRPSYSFDPSPQSGRLTITSFIEFEWRS